MYEQRPRRMRDKARWEVRQYVFSDGHRVYFNVPCQEVPRGPDVEHI